MTTTQREVKFSVSCLKNSACCPVMFQWFQLLNVLPIMKCSTDWNKWKSLGAGENGRMADVEKIFHPNGLIFGGFVLQSVSLFSAEHAVALSCWSGEQHLIHLPKLDIFDIMLHLSGKHLQWWSFHVLVPQNGWGLSYSTRHKSKDFCG